LKQKPIFSVFLARRGFASTLVAVLAVVFVSALAAVLLASSAQQRSLLASFESRKAANHFGNAERFLNASLRDALLDYEFDSTGCPASARGFVFSDLAKGYLRSAARELNASGIETNFTSLTLEYGKAASSPPFDYFVVANASLALFVRTGSAFKNESVLLEQRVDVNYTGIAWVHAWKANSSGLLVTVPCP
jgi:hypothetical protein